jgi:hypothetical protein
VDYGPSKAARQKANALVKCIADATDDGCITPKGEQMDTLPREVKYLLHGETDPRVEVYRNLRDALRRAAAIMREHWCAIRRLTVSLHATD